MSVDIQGYFSRVHLQSLCRWNAREYICDDFHDCVASSVQVIESTVRKNFKL